MPRTRRLILPATPHHIIQRGHNRQNVFTTDGLFERYLDELRELSDQHGVQVNAYCLMTNHVHLLLTPGEETSGLSHLMKALASSTARYRNWKEKRTGALWESRFKSSPVQSGTYMLACTRYIELNPVRAGLVAGPSAWPWSSYRQRMGYTDDTWIQRDPTYLGLGEIEERRRQRYRAFARAGCPKNELDLVRNAVQRCQLTGNKQFISEVEAMTGHRIEPRRPGRPARNSA